MTVSPLIRAGMPRELMTRLAGRLDADIDLDVDELGVRDELAAPAREVHDDRTRVTVRLYGHLALLGPVRGPDHRRPCGQCLTRRWQGLRIKEFRDAFELGGTTEAVGRSPHLTRFAVETMAALLDRLLVAPSDPEWPAMTARVVLLDMSTLRTLPIPLVADPDCPACGGLRPDDGRHLADPLISVPKPTPLIFRGRLLDDLTLPEEVLTNPVCGVVGAAAVRDRTATTTASVAGRMDLRSETYLHETFWGGHAASYRDSARVGMLEALERYAGMRSRAKAVHVQASYTALVDQGERVLHPADCGLYTEDAYRTMARPVARFDEERPIPWVWAYSLRDRRSILVPELLTYYHSVPLAERFVQECSNGCASGSSLTEAVHFGLMELIERDAFLLTWYGALQLPEIDGSTSAGAGTRAMIDRLELYGYRARFFDARMTFGIPVVIGVAERREPGLGALCFGAGASLDPESALRSALVEIATDAPPLADRARRKYRELRPMVDDFSLVHALHDHPILYGLPEMARHAGFLLGERDRLSVAETYARIPPAPAPADDLRDDVEACVRMLGEAGHDVIVVDQSTEFQRRLGLQTASVIVPGLLPIDFGWSRQRAPHMSRMRTAPRLAGFRDRDLTPDNLNWAPHPFP